MDRIGPVEAPEPGVDLGDRAGDLDQLARPGTELGNWRARVEVGVTELVEGLLDEMKKRGIETHLGHKMKGMEANKVMTEGGEFDADLILFMPGMTGNKWFDDTDLPRSPGGMIQADRHCQVEGFDKVYVAGDSGSFPGPDWMPKQAHMADLQAEAAVAMAKAERENAGVQHRRAARIDLGFDRRDVGQGAVLVGVDEQQVGLGVGLPVVHWTTPCHEMIGSASTSFFRPLAGSTRCRRCRSCRHTTEVQPAQSERVPAPDNSRGDRARPPVSTRHRVPMRAACP